MTRRTRTNRLTLAALACAAAFVTLSAVRAQTPTPTPARPSVYQTTLEEPNQKTPEITTEELQQILASNSEPVFDVRTAKEYAIAHIPGTINVFEKEVERITELHPDRTTRMILYCNGPSCGKSKRTSEQLVALGYTNVRRYQLGIPVWRALSLTVQTDLAGLQYIFRGDRTSVFVDARTPAEFNAATLPGAVNIQAGEATAANDDGRLPLTDKGTRVVVFGATAQQARTVAAEIAKRAYWNSSYFGGTFDDLGHAGYVVPSAISAGALRIDANDFYVAEHYKDFLGREPDEQGLQFWQSEIASCGADAACAEVKRVNVSAAFFLSIEFQQTGYLAHRFERVSFGRMPRYAKFTHDSQAVGRGLVVGQAGWEERLETNKRAFADEWVGRPEFVSRYGALTDEQYVEALFRNAGVTPSPSVRTALVAGLRDRTETRATALRKVAEDETFVRREFTAAFVLMEYFGYLRRNPDDAPDGNMSGYNFWLSKLNQFNGDFVAAEMVKAFLSSAEYRSRFTQVS